MATIDQFKAQLTAGGVRSNRFKVFIPRVGDKVEFLVKTAGIPTEAIGIIESKFRGATLKLAGERTYEDWTVTVINDVDFSIRTGIENWMSEIIDRDAGTGATELDYLVSRASVSQLHRDDSVLATYEFYNMFPTNLGAIALDMDTEEVQTYDITFTYSHFERTV